MNKSGALAKTIQSRFEERCRELLCSMVEQAHYRDHWDIYLAKGAGDRAIAGDHEERHLLELLQNARDAIFRERLDGEALPGRVLVAVTERGMAVANTGAPFQLDTEQVLKAVRFLMRSDKSGTGFVGHKGIGLKSILLRAGAFSVRSRIAGETLRATFSRYRTAEFLLDQMPESSDERRYILEELPRMPLFTQPHPDSANGDTLGTDTSLVEALLGNGLGYELGLDSKGLPCLPDPYVTVVYLPFQDTKWEELLDVLEDRIEPNSLFAFHQARQQMKTMSSESSDDDLWRELRALDPRVLVLLGEIHEIQFVRFRNGRLVEARRVDIDRPLSPLNGSECAPIQRVQLSMALWELDDKSAQLRESRSFLVLSAPTELGVESDTTDDTGPGEHVRILLEIPSSKDFLLKDEPLFLYYPIEASLSGLPFLIHGPFRVNSSRTALVPSQEDHNRRVLQEAVALLRKSLATLLEPSNPMRVWLPWVLLPQVDPGDDTGSSRNTLSQQLVESTTNLLKASQCIPTTCGTALPTEVFFFPSRPQALALFEELSVGQEKVSEHLHLLARENRLNYEQLLSNRGERWQRAAHNIGLGAVELLSVAQALGQYLGQAAGGQPLSVEADSARAYFLGLCALLVKEDGKIDHAVAEVLGQSRVPLLPAFEGSEKNHDGSSLLLVPTEPLREEGAPRTHQAGRVVLVC